MLENGSGESAARGPDASRGPGKNRAMNRALEVARGRLLIFSDDDVIPGPGLGARDGGGRRSVEGARDFGRPGPSSLPGGHAGMAQGVRLPGGQSAPVRAAPGGRPARVCAVRSRTTLSAEPYWPVFGSTRAIGPTAGTSYAMGSETELLFRLMKHQGVGAVYVPDAAIQHVVLPTQLETASLLRRSFRSGRSAVRLGWDRHVDPPGPPGPRSARHTCLADGPEGRRQLCLEATCRTAHEPGCRSAASRTCSAVSTSTGAAQPPPVRPIPLPS